MHSASRKACWEHLGWDRVTAANQRAAFGHVTATGVGDGKGGAPGGLQLDMFPCNDVLGGVLGLQACCAFLSPK